MHKKRKPNNPPPPPTPPPPHVIRKGIGGGERVGFGLQKGDRTGKGIRGQSWNGEKRN